MVLPQEVDPGSPPCARGGRLSPESPTSFTRTRVYHRRPRVAGPARVRMQFKMVGGSRVRARSARRTCSVCNPASVRLYSITAIVEAQDDADAESVAEL